jgi:hypothetical protein
MVTRWGEYRTENGDALDENFFNARLKSIDKRLTDLEETLTGLEGQTSGLVRDSVAQLNAASAAAQVEFQNTLDAALTDVQQAQTDIADLTQEVQDLLGTLGTNFQVDCENGSKVQIRGSATPGAVPLAANIDPRELYINYADKKLHYKNSAGVVETVDLNTTGANMLAKVLAESTFAAQILAKLLTVDGIGSGLDADTLDGQHAASFAPMSHTHDAYVAKGGDTINGVVAINANSVDPALKLKQTGAGDVIRVEDEEGDLTPFRVAADGTVYCGSLSPYDAAATRASIGAAPVNNPTFTGTPAAPTPAADDNTTKIATTAYVQGELGDRVPTSRTVTGSGLASGGGDLSANRTIAVPKASQAQAEAGADDATAMTPLQTKNAITALAPTLTNLKWMGRNLTVINAAPSGGVDGDIWFEREA